MSDKPLRILPTLAAFITFWAGSIILANTWVDHNRQISALTHETQLLTLENERLKYQLVVSKMLGESNRAT